MRRWLTLACSCRGPKRFRRRRMCFSGLDGGGLSRPAAEAQAVLPMPPRCELNRRRIEAVAAHGLYPADLFRASQQHTAEYPDPGGSV